MKTFRFISVAILFTFCAIAGFSQVPAKAPTKVGLVNIFSLGDKGGITKYVNALTVLDKEFSVEIKALQTLAADIKTKTTAYNSLNAQAAKPNSPITQATVAAKAGEINGLKREAKFKQESLQAKINARRQTLIGPIWQDMMKAMKTYAQEKGFSVILDGAKLEEAAIMLAFNNQSDITKDFIKYYNARPAGTASTK